MIFWASSEVFKPAFDGQSKSRRLLEPILNAAFEKSALVSFDVTFRYVPIIMPVSMHVKYTERSKLRRKQRIIECAPQLDYETFVSGPFEAQLTEYVRGISTCTHMLSKLGADTEQVTAFEHILSGSVAAALEADRLKSMN